jgi:hypothetical protein
VWGEHLVEPVRQRPLLQARVPPACSPRASQSAGGLAVSHMRWILERVVQRKNTTQML